MPSVSIPVAAAATIGGAVISSQAAGSAAKTEASAATAGQGLQAQMFQQVQQNLQPYMTAGGTALNALMYGLGLGPAPGAAPASSAPAPAPVTSAATVNTPSGPVPTGYWGYDTSKLPLGASYSGGGQYSMPGSSDNSGDINGQLPLTWINVPQSSLTAAGATGAPAPTPTPAPAPAPAGGYSGALGNSGSLDARFNPTMASLAATPGYQFILQQGLQGVQNSYAASGLGTSGPALKGAANYAEGLAGTTYQQQFENYLAQNQQIYNMLGGVVSQGQASAAGLAGPAVQSGASQASMLGQAGSALAAGTVGGANALSGGLGSLGQSGVLYGLLANSGMFGGGVTPPQPTPEPMSMPTS